MRFEMPGFANKRRYIHLCWLADSGI